jgi:SAM-dependent methyltransferase
MRAHGGAGATAYDEVPYTDHAYAEAHPDRLATVARLSGWRPAPVARARVLEIGCGRGGNLLPMAAALPEARLEGIDSSLRQIDEARHIAEQCGLANVTFAASRFEDAPAGTFDFVLCHGVFSWIPVAARRVLLERVARWLAPGGIAYVSFNVLPGWYARMAARDWLRSGGDLGWLMRQTSDVAYKEDLARVAQRLERTERAYQVHEYLAPDHHPVLVREFFDELGAAGLTYLGDAIPAHVALELLPEEAAARARALDARGAQEIVDFVTNAAFRRALLVRSEDAAARGWRWPATLDPRKIERVASRLRPAGEGRFDTGAKGAPGEVSVQIEDGPMRRALERLAEAAPRSLPLQGLGCDPAEILDLWLLTGALDLVSHEPPIGSTSPCPRGCPVARWHAAHGGPITNRRHHEVVLVEPLVRAVLARLDGTQSIDALAREMGDLVRAAVELLARSALLEP